METNTPAIADEIKPYLNEIAEKLWSGHAAVMVGAGFSRNADRNPQSLKNFPDWNQLGDIFYKKIHGKFPGTKSRYLNPLKLAGEVDAAFGRPILNKLLFLNIPDDEYEPSQLHTDLLKLPWTDVFTTNYDTLLERACVNVESKKFDIVLNKDDLIYSEKPRIVKLHGSFPSERPFIITEEDYRTYPKKFAPFVNTVQQSLLENTLCIIGFSGDDPNFLKWIGWIRDNLGEGNSPKMFLIGIFDLSDAQKKLLEKRHINLVDMSVYTDIEKDEHAKALDVFFRYLFSKKKDDDKLGWPFDQKFMFPDTEVSIQKLEEVATEWKNKRKSYPNWVILSEDRRRSLWAYTSAWADAKKHSDKLETPHDIEFLYEQNWRLEKCLCPIYNDNIDAYQAIVEKYNPYPTIITIEHASVVMNDNAHQDLNWQDVGAKWLELHISMMRYYREEGFLDEWKVIDNRLGQLYSILPDELTANLHYERCLFALFTLKISDIREQIRLWPVNESLPFWEAKRAGLLAELGEINEAEKILEMSLSGIRQHLNLTPISKDYSWVSKEAFVMLLLRCVKDAIFFNRKEGKSKYSDEDIKEEFLKDYQKKIVEYDKQKNEESMGNSDIGTVRREGLGDFKALWDELRNNRYKGDYKKQWESLVNNKRYKEHEEIKQEFNKRWDYLKQYKCDPWLDFKLFDNCLEREPRCFVPTSEKHEFDIGRTTITNNFGAGDTEAIVAYSFLRYFEEAGIPFRIPGLQIGVKLAVGAVKRVGGYSPYWSLATFLRTGESKATDIIFGRDYIYKKTAKQIDRFIEEYLQILKTSKTEIEKGNRFFGNNFGIVLATVIPELLSRLCIKCSTNVKDKLLSFLKEIYASDHRDKYKGMSNLIKRLLDSYSASEQYSRLSKLLEFTVLKNLNHIIRDEYPEPFNFIDFNKENLAKSKDVQIDQKEVSQLLLKVGSDDSDERRRAIRRVSVLYELKLLDEEQGIEFAKALWSQIDESTGFPKCTDYYMFAFLESLPHPKNIDPVFSFRGYVAKEEFPIQKTKAEKGIAMTGGYIPFCHELIGATKRPAFINGIDWSADEAIAFFNRLLEWWDLDKEFTKNDGGSKYFDKSGEFKKRFSNLTRLLNHVIIPRLSPQVSIKRELRRLLDELYEYDIPCVFTCAASLRLFPEQKQEVFGKINLAVLSKHEEKIRDGYNAIYEIFVLCNAKKIDEIPRDICVYITSPIKWRSLPSLINAMRIAIDILKKMPEVFTEESLSDMLFGLDSLIEETSLQNQQSPFDTTKSLEVRYFAASLAYALYNYHLKRSFKIPKVIRKWKNICNDAEEVSEIRNKWVNRF